MMKRENNMKVLGLITAAIIGIAPFTAMADSSINISSNTSSSAESSIPQDSGTGTAPRIDKGNAEDSTTNQGTYSTGNLSRSQGDSPSQYQGGSNTATTQSQWLAERQISQTDGAPSGSASLPSFYNPK